jgi:hypothetical protein
MLGPQVRSIRIPRYGLGSASPGTVKSTPTNQPARSDPTAFLETYTGGGFQPFDPDPADVRLADIAGGLAHTCRFGGHCRRFYSVAQHSLHVASELADHGPRLELLGLLHDAGEAYLGDVPRPVKAEFESFERAEERVLESVWAAVGVEAPTTEEWEVVMAADDRLLAYEADELLADGSWADDPPDLGYELGSAPIPAVRERFRTRAERLLESVG